MQTLFKIERDTQNLEDIEEINKKCLMPYVILLLRVKNG